MVKIKDNAPDIHVVNSAQDHEMITLNINTLWGGNM